MSDKILQESTLTAIGQHTRKVVDKDIKERKKWSQKRERFFTHTKNSLTLHEESELKPVNIMGKYLQHYGLLWGDKDYPFSTNGLYRYNGHL